LSAWRAVATSSTAEGHLDPRLTNDDRDGGLPDRESPAAPGSSPPKRALPPLPCWPRPTVRLTPTPDRPSRKGKSAAGRAQSPAGWRKPRPPPSDKAVRAGVDKVPPCRIAPPFRWPGEWAGRYRSIKRAAVEKPGSRPLGRMRGRRHPKIITQTPSAFDRLQTPWLRTRFTRAGHRRIDTVLRRPRAG